MNATILNRDGVVTGFNTIGKKPVDYEDEVHKSVNL